jgi:hypothetical protein
MPSWGVPEISVLNNAAQDGIVEAPGRAVHLHGLACEGIPEGMCPRRYKICSHVRWALLDGNVR